MILCIFVVLVTISSFYLFIFLGSHPWHMEVPRLGVKLELQLPATATATATQNPSHVCNLCHSSRQHRILNPLRVAKDWTRNLMVHSRIHFCCTTEGNPSFSLLIYLNPLFFSWLIWWRDIKFCLCFQGISN